MKLTINYKFKNINQYINECRTDYHIANKTKQQETMLSALAFSKIPKITKYPIEITFRWHIKSKIADLDGRLAKNIIDGLVKSNSSARLVRDGKVIYTGKINSLQREKDSVKEVKKGLECGITIANFNDIKVDDVIEAYEMVEVER